MLGESLLKSLILSELELIKQGGRVLIPQKLPIGYSYCTTAISIHLKVNNNNNICDVFGQK